MTVKVDFLGGDMGTEFGLPPLVPSVMKPNQYRDLIVAEIKTLNQSKPTSNYILDVKIASKFIKVWVSLKTTGQKIDCILDICEKTIYIQNQYDGKDEKSTIMIVTIVNEDNTDKIEFKSWREVYENLSDYIPILRQYL